MGACRSSVVWFAMGLGLVACSSADTPERITNFGGGTTTASGGTPSSGGFVPTGGTSTGGVFFTGGVSLTGGVGGEGGAPTETGGAVDPNQCGARSVQPEIIEVEVPVEVTRAAPIAINIMLDLSFSMVALWPGATQAITDFVNDPKSAGLDVALSVFPPFGGDQCAAATYVPTVPMGRLPAHAGNIAMGLPAFPAGLGTPIEGALRGATEFCKNFTPADPADAGEKCVVLFITDGEPSGCAIDAPTIISAAQAAGIPTYTIALQGVPDLTLLNGIADATGTDCDPASPNSACDLTMGDSFVDALALIRDTIVTVETVVEQQVKPLTCEWGLPEPDPQRGFDQEEVNVVLNGSTPQTFAKVKGADACGDSTMAWHYDVEENPTRILACPETCKVIEAAEGASIDIQLGCPTIILE